jgi:hypothetical protein
VAFRADAALAKREIYDPPEQRSVAYAIRVPACNLGNLWWRLVLPKRLDSWSLTSPQQRLVKIGGRLVKHAQYDWLLLAKGHLTRRPFGSMLLQTWALPVPTG